MKKTLIFIVATFVIITSAYAALTVGTVPVVKVAGKNPQLQDSPITVSGANIGISQASPVYKLDVNGTVKMTGFRLGSSSTSGYVLTSDANGVGTYQPSVGGGSGSGTVSSGTSGKVAVYSGTTTVGPGIITDNGTTVGVGVASPAEKLEVNGAVKATSFIGTASGASSTTGNLSVGGNVIIPAIKSTSGTRYVCIDSDGVISSSATACSGT
jgi:hypothetical protein